jgi:predicted Zn-dependent protease
MIMTKARFDPREAVELWRRMEQVGGRIAPAFVSTHPAPRARIEALEQILPEVLQSASAAR